ncbi:transmembrane protein 18-domain-containing protein [Lobosporangium transversale]|uniref:Transmembrane protein 18-domain-containing protein n=1 Tax=Lobosporangium transversale TaxID=64571 RepID=A0A1Y2GKX9_9FUNG|nr:transmembrane protein 18-domain-containing protein [Lobosporangium transversale]ORZ10581.1 transmembrane protein 18-domain-containing protein [Lobosporangium transversale]|eukprot:XP_021879302.1 transmembrane protein 18-domain-containing protein [Lobosporangium transversale]
MASLLNISEMSSGISAEAERAAAGASGGTQGTSQFWDDFWNTLYQFTHPFSSTFFDSLFSDIDADSQEAILTKPQSPDAQATGAATVESNAKLHFKDASSFNKFWHGLQKGKLHHDSQLNTPLDHAKAAWADFIAASTGFVSSIEWQQTWILLILTLHLCIFVTIILLRNKPNALAATLLCTIVFAALSEPLNRIGNRHWQVFSDDNYFDEHGVFTSLVWAGPHISNAFLAVIFLLKATATMLIKVKKAQLQSQYKKRK